MAIYIKDGKLYNTAFGIEHEEFTTYNPTHEMMVEWGYELYVPNEEIPKEDERFKILRRIDELKSQLAETDYIALKAIEGYDCDIIYPGWKLQRREIRDVINELEEQLIAMDESDDSGEEL